MSKYHFSRLFMAAYNAVILKVAGVSGVAAFAVVGYTSYLVQMIMIGIGQGMTPLVSFVYGAWKKRIWSALY